MQYASCRRHEFAALPIALPAALRLRRRGFPTSWAAVLLEKAPMTRSMAAKSSSTLKPAAKAMGVLGQGIKRQLGLAVLFDEPDNHQNRPRRRGSSASESRCPFPGIGERSDLLRQGAQHIGDGPQSPYNGQQVKLHGVEGKICRFLRPQQPLIGPAASLSVGHARILAVADQTARLLRRPFPAVVPSAKDLIIQTDGQFVGVHPCLNRADLIAFFVQLAVDPFQLRLGLLLAWALFAGNSANSASS